MNWRRVAAERLSSLPRPESFALTEGLFIRLLGFVYFVSFASFWPQIAGLNGKNGIFPAAQMMESLHAAGARVLLQIPTIFWFGVSDGALIACCAVGCLSGLVMMTGYGTRIAAFVCWVLYLSLANAGQPFSNFQWDALLLECGFLALFRGAPLLRFAYRFLLFRLMFESGIVKLTSHDPNWHSLHALRFHFMTQPLPNPLAYYAYCLPNWLLDSMTLGSLVIELVVPFFLFAPRKLREPATGLLMLLQVIILLTGNYAFFNLLTLALCLWGLDDHHFRSIAEFLNRGYKPLPASWLRIGTSFVLAVLIFIGGTQVLNASLPVLGSTFSRVGASLGPFEIVNSYGLFAIMTTTRPEIVLEGSNDLQNWREYEFKYKPGDPHRSLPLVAPYQPRLDWQMWFAALGTYEENTWVGNLMYRLLTGEPSVVRLLNPPPFPQPPKYIRAVLYDYRFTTPVERKRTGAVWNRSMVRTWFGPVSLKAS